MINSGTEARVKAWRQEPATKQYAYLLQLPNPVAVLKGSGYVIELANARMLELWGKTSEEVLFRPFFEVFPEKGRAGLATTFQQVLQNGQEVICPEVPQSFFRNGRTVAEIHKVILAPLVQYNGFVEGLLVVNHDITDSVKDRTNLEEKEAFIRTVLESSPDCVKVLNEAGQLDYMNHQGLCIMEIADFCMVQGRYWWELWPAESQEIVRASVHQALGGTTASFQAFCPTAKGTPKWWDVIVSPINSADGKISQLIAVSRDITCQKNAAKAIGVRNLHLDLLARTAQALIVSDKEENALLQSIFDDVCHTLDLEMFYNFLAEPENSVLRLNTYGGLTPAEASFFSVIQYGEYMCGQVAMNRKCIIAENITVEAYEGAEALRATGVQAYAGFPLIAKHQLIGTIAFTTRQRAHFREGEIQLIQAICDQIAATVERSRLNKELQQSEEQYRNLAEKLEFLVEGRTRELEWLNKELQRSNEDLQQFAHVASHDLKEPVRKVLTFNGRLVQEFGAQMPEKAKQYLSRIEVSAKRSYDMIEGLLHYAKVNSSIKVPEPLNLGEVLQHIETDLEVVIQEKGAVIKYDQLPIIEGAPELIYQLFYNLVANALKFSKPGVPPQVSIWAKEVCGGTLVQDNGGQTPAKWLTICVQDNGIGFDQEHAEKIFQTYARLHSKDQIEGSGLGLALCRKIVERHDGTIEAHGIKDQGARFVITLPLIV